MKLSRHRRAILRWVAVRWRIAFMIFSLLEMLWTAQNKQVPCRTQEKRRKLRPDGGCKGVFGPVREVAMVGGGVLCFRCVVGCCVLATLGVVCDTAKGFGGAKNAESLPASVAGEPTLAAPGPEASLAAFGVVEKWVRAWESPAVAVTCPPITAVAVTLRLSGRIVGRAVSIAGNGRGEEFSLAEATRGAMRNAEERVPRGEG